MTVPTWSVAAAVVIIACLACGLLSQSISHANGGSSTNQTQANTGTSVPQATHAPTHTTKPTATTKPKAWVTVKSYSGSGNTQTDTLNLPDGAHIVWSYNATDSSANLFSVSLYTSDGQLQDLVANDANMASDQATYTIHGAGSYYFNVQALSVNWTINVQEYQ